MSFRTISILIFMSALTVIAAGCSKSTVRDLADALADIPVQDAEVKDPGKEDAAADKGPDTVKPDVPDVPDVPDIAGDFLPDEGVPEYEQEPDDGEPAPEDDLPEPPEDIAPDDAADEPPGEDIPDCPDLAGAEDEGGEPDPAAEEDAGPDVPASDEGDAEAVQTDQGPPPKVCDNQPLAPLASGVCEVTAGDPGQVLFQGDLLMPDGLLVNGRMLVAGGKIVCAGCDCLDAPGAAAATRVECPKGLITPGLINAHDHLSYDHMKPASVGTERYDHRHEWRCGCPGSTKINTWSNSGAARWGELRMVMGGATSIIGSSEASGLLRNLDGGSEGVGVATATYDTFPLGDSKCPDVCNFVTSGCGFPKLPVADVISDFHCWIPHVSEGINSQAQREIKCLSSSGTGGVDMLGPNVAFIHGIGALAEDSAAMAGKGASLVWSPRSNVALYGNTAPVTVYGRLGTQIAIGTDWSASGSMNVPRELKCVDYLNKNHFDSFFTERDIVDLAMGEAALAARMETVVGYLKPGYWADIAIFDQSAHQGYRAVIDAAPADVALVTRGGLPLYGDAAVVAALTGSDPKCEVMPVCGVEKRVCAERETGSKVAGLGNSDWYDLYFCGDPDGEPTCVPSRPGEYPKDDGKPDADGDGIEDSADNCPDVFNPLRPIDGGKQADSDGDGTGDACDPCPLPDGCPKTSFTDIDGDGVANGIDNCPRGANDDQGDADGDGKGDACDPCPGIPDAGAQPCQATIRDIKDKAAGKIKEGAWVSMTDVLVTGIGKKPDGVLQGWFIQMVPGDPGYSGPEYSGLYVYGPLTNPFPKVGDRMSFRAFVGDYWGQIQLSGLSNLTTASSGNPPPEPVQVDPPDLVCTGKEKAVPFEAVLVTVKEVKVTAVALPPIGGDKDPTNEFQVAGCLPVNDFVYKVPAMPEIGVAFASLTGILRWANNASKVEPRGPGDLVLSGASVKLAAFGPELSWAIEGTTAVPIPALTVTTSAPAANDVKVKVTSSDPGLLDIPDGEVAVQAGKTAAQVEVAAIKADPEPVTLTASLGGVELTAKVRVVGAAETPKIAAIAPETLEIGLGVEGEVTVTLDIPALAGPIDIQISADQAGVLLVPDMTTVEKGAFAVAFTVQGLTPGDVVVTVKLGDSSGSVKVHVIDFVPVGLLLAEVYYDPPGTDDGLEWVRLYNGTVGPIDLSEYSLGWGGANYVYGTMQLSGTVASGKCFLVGGDPAKPVTDPVYDLVLKFSPNIQNDDGDADGVALFHAKKADLTASTVPIDAVIYGGTNKNGLMDETGNPGAVDVGDAPSGKSLVRLSKGKWAIQDLPTPNGCTVIK